MKTQKILIVVIAVALLCSFVSLAYSDDDEHPWLRGLVLWKLRTEIRENEIEIIKLKEEIEALKGEIATIYSLIEGMQPEISPLVGTWVNSEYDGSMIDPTIMGFPAKIVSEQEGEVIFGSWYLNADDIEPLGTAPLNMEEEWYDEEGNYYLTHWSYAGDPPVIYQLFRVSADGQILEMMIDFNNYPAEIDPSFETYGILYRVE